MKHIKLTYILFLVFALSCKNTDTSQVTNSALPLSGKLQVYQYDSSKQCEGVGIALDVMAKSLIDNGIDVSCSQKGRDTVVRKTLCGSDTGILNLYEIDASNLTAARLLKFKPTNELLNYSDTQCDPNLISTAQVIQQIYKYDNSVVIPETPGSSPPKPIPVSSISDTAVTANTVSDSALTIVISYQVIMTEELINAGIDVICTQIANDGVNGVPDGNFSIFEIESSKLSVAETLGYKLVINLLGYNDTPCQLPIR